MSWSMTDDYRLYIDGYTPDELPYDYEHRNVSDWYMNSVDIVSNDIIPTPIGWQEPLPIGVWYMTDDLRITANGIPQRLRWTKPYPYSVWYFDEDLDHVFDSAIPESLSFTGGAFRDSVNLKYIKVSSTVTDIGPYSFANTGLTLVQLPIGCRYSETTFPPGCEIQFYDV